MNGSIWCIPFTTLGEIITVITVLYPTVRAELVISVLMNIAPHALPMLDTAWHLGQLHV
jgi:hypothetical protein